jgi:hypothetical protein
MTDMTLTRFKQLCETYGGNAERWPAGEREAALAFASGSPEARAFLTQAAELDERLNALPALAPSATLRSAILAASPRSTAGSRLSLLAALRDELFGWRPALPALAMALVAGIALGLRLSAESGTNDQLDVVQVATFHNDFEDY